MKTAYCYRCGHNTPVTKLANGQTRCDGGCGRTWGTPRGGWKR